MAALCDRAVVTGGAGAIGSQLVRRLLQDGCPEVVVIDDLSSGHSWLLPDDPRVTLVVDNVTNLLGSGLSASGSLVFHLAAFFANQNSVDHPLEDLDTNGAGTLTTLLWAQRTGALRLVYASAGCSIAGHDVVGPIREDMPMSLSLSTPYQITKALGEFYCNYFLETLSTVRCRFFNAYGPGEVPGSYRNVIPNFIWSALHDEPLTITGTGAETRDFIFVQDLVDGLVRAATTQEAAGEAFNLGTGIQTRVDELSRLIIEMCQSRSEVVFGDRRAWDHSTTRQANIEKAREVLGFCATVALRDGLKATIGWFRDHYNYIDAEPAVHAMHRPQMAG